MQPFRSPVLRRLLAGTAAIIAAPVLVGTSAHSLGSPATVAGDLARSAVEATPEPAGLVGLDGRDGHDGRDGRDGIEVVRREVEGDMIVDWLDEGPAEEPAVDHVQHAGHDTGDEFAGGTYEAAAPAGGGTSGGAGGFALMSPSARWLPDGYTLRLTGADARVEQLRRELTAAAAGASAAAGRPVRVAPGTGGPTEPSRGEITVVIGTGPCGGGAWGCGGPAIGSNQILSGRIWISAAVLGASPAQRANVAVHELGHALGLAHYGADWSDGRQAMHPTVSTVTSYRDGDRRGLRASAGPAEKPRTAPPPPFGRLDAVTGSFTTMRVVGWAIDPQTAAPAEVQVRRNGTVVSTARAGVTRRDVAAQHPQHGAARGFDLEIPAVAGTNDICVRIVAGAGRSTDLGCRRVAHAVDPVGAFEALPDPLGVRLVGWALDPNTPEPVNVRASVGGSVQPLPGTFAASAPRRGGVPGHPAHGERHGFSQQLVLPPGDHEVCLTAVNVGLGRDRSLGCARVRVQPAAVVQEIVASVGSAVRATSETGPIDNLVAGLLGGSS